MSQLVLAFAAGVLTILSPCVLPLAPVVIAGARASDPRAPLFLALGLAVTFGVAGGVMASLGVEAGGSGGVRTISAAIMAIIGLVMLLPALSSRTEQWLSPLTGVADRLAQRLPKAGIIGQIGLGAVLALAWAPCAGPALGAAFALAASGGTLAAAMAVMAVFALGAAGALLVAGYGLGRLAKPGRKLAGQASAAGRILLGATFAATGLLILTGADHIIEAHFVEAMPDWLVAFATRF